MAPDRAQIALPPRAGLSSPSLPPKHPGRKLFDAALRRRGAAHPRRPAGEPWDAEHFGLHKASAFRALDARRRQAVLAGCARGVLEEAYFIEKLGLAFAAPFLGGTSNIMGILIIGIGLYEAWKINRRVPLSGPFRFGPATPPLVAAAPGGPPPAPL